MTQEQKELLIKDLCARLPYNVMVCVEVNDVFIKPTDEVATTSTINMFECPQKFKITPYLRPMSSMTLIEECEFCRLFECDSINATYGYVNWNVGGSCDCYDFDIEFSKLAKITDWLNKKMFDYRGLIPMGIALEAPKDMYKN